MKNSMKVILVGFLALFCVGNALAGTMKDPRDGKTYKTVKIGNQVWMAENLNYDVEGSVCYDNKPANCKKYGRLYTLYAASCPSGWHLPSKEEIKAFLEAVKKRTEHIVIQKELSGKSLKMGEDETSYHLRSVSWKGGFNTFGFSALPAGDYTGAPLNRFLGLGSQTVFWAGICDWGGSYGLIIGPGGDAYFNGISEKCSADHKYSVRCLKD